jgi:hypothetical protein
MIVQVGLFLVTLGLYSIYWYYATLKELHVANGKDDSPVLWTVLLIVPIANLLAWWHYGSEVESFTNDKYPGFAIFIVWIIFAPIVWVLVQMELNKVAKGPEMIKSPFDGGRF